MIKIQRLGFSKKAIVSNVALGLFDGIDSTLWCYAFAAIIFSGSLSLFLPVGLGILLCGWAVLSIITALASKVPVHMMAIEEQGVVITGSIAAAFVASVGEGAVTEKGLATMLVIMSVTALSVGLSFMLASRYRVAGLLELLPYPVICGFMAGISWLLFDAGVQIALDEPLSSALWSTLAQGSNGYKLLACVLGGLFLLWFTNKVEKAWSLPTATLIILMTFIGFVFINQLSIEELKAQGWIFSVPKMEGGAIGALRSINLENVDVGFIISVIPQIVTIVLLTLLSASMNLSALSSIHIEDQIDNTEEFKIQGTSNLLCGFFGCLPGVTDAPASTLYREFGASTRWMPLASSLVCLLVAFSGDWLISYTPKVAIGATIFLFAFQLAHDWLYANVAKFSKPDYAIVCIILLTVIFFGFMQGIALGVILAMVMFVVRYSQISSIQSQFTLSNTRSRVERSSAVNKLLDVHGSEVKVFVLRGYLFFGTAISVRDLIRKQVVNNQLSAVLIDMRHVSDMDISAARALSQLTFVCSERGTKLHYSGDSRLLRKMTFTESAEEAFELVKMHPEADYAIEAIEEEILQKYRENKEHPSIQEQLNDILGDQDKVNALMKMLRRQTLSQGETLFNYGDENTGFYIVESGLLTAYVKGDEAKRKRVKKFNSGSIVGEISNYTDSNTRTATVEATTDVVLYYAPLSVIKEMPVIHELLAHTMAYRIEFSTRRLMQELF